MPDARPGVDPPDEAAVPGGVPPGATADPASDAARAALRRAKAAARVRSPRAHDSGATRARSGTRPVDRGEEPRSGPRPDDRDPQPLSSAVPRLVRDRGWSAQAAVGGVVGRWAEIVGPEVADHAAVESFDAAEGRLVVRAASTAWATQLRLMLGTLRARLDAELGRDVVREVTVLAPTSPSWRKGPRHVAGRGPRDTYG